MGNIKKPFFGQGQLFPLSKIAVSKDLYILIVEAVNEKAGSSIKKITRRCIANVFGAPEFESKVGFSWRPCFNFPVVVREISLCISYTVDDEDPFFAVVEISLQLPLIGTSLQMGEVIRRIACSVGLETSQPSQDNGINIKINLSGENLPYQITPNPFPSFNGRGRKVFVTKKEILSGHYSPID